MTNKQARRKCVNHWKRMLKLTVEDIRNEKEAPIAENCAFCNLYFDLGVDGCTGCPVMKKTGEQYCDNTPYGKASSIYNKIQFGSKTSIRPFYKAVQKEIDFLEALEL